MANIVSAVKMREVEDHICHKRDDEASRKRERAGEDIDSIIDNSFDWDPSPGTNKKWKRQVTSGKLNRMVRKATNQPFVPRGVMRRSVAKKSVRARKREAMGDDRGDDRGDDVGVDEKALTE